MSSSSRIYGRTLARCQALQLMFQAEASGRSVADVLAGDYVLSEGPLDEYGEQVARGCDEHKAELDRVLSGAAHNWSLSRMSATDRNLLRIALYETLFVDEVDRAVAIDECVELAKAFGSSDESSRFVNGVLGRIAKDLDEGIDVIEAARDNVVDLPVNGASYEDDYFEGEPSSYVPAAYPYDDELEADSAAPVAYEGDVPEWAKEGE